MSSNPTKSQATNAENAKNPKESSDWLGGPQNGNETPGEGAGGNVQGVDTQTGTQAKGMGSAGYTKHRFNETPSEAARNPQGGIQKPTEAAPSSSDSNPVTSTKNDETWSGRGKA